MSQPVVTIETLLKHNQQFWQVRMGKRCLTFSNERAARSFAAQLHMRVQWLNGQTSH
ncbi:hypothetical protein WG219_09680 [Ectopseudomonas mendocina]|uniref:Uncharacterized protein n=1 Tax=Ectopseudomonas mendocina TaxID=300 RepID=A0ABZ2RTU2_ECTME